MDDLEVASRCSTKEITSKRGHTHLPKVLTLEDSTARIPGKYWATPSRFGSFLVSTQSLWRGFTVKVKVLTFALPGVQPVRLLPTLARRFTKCHAHTFARGVL